MKKIIVILCIVIMGIAFLVMPGSAQTDPVCGNPHILGQGEDLLQALRGADLDKGDFNLDSQLDPWGFQYADIAWNFDEVHNYAINPVNSAGIENLGIVDFDAITGEQLAQLPYSSATIGVTNGEVFAVLTTHDNYAK